MKLTIYQNQLLKMYKRASVLGFTETARIALELLIKELKDEK